MKNKILKSWFLNNKIFCCLPTCYGTRLVAMATCQPAPVCWAGLWASSSAQGLPASRGVFMPADSPRPPGGSLCALSWGSLHRALRYDPACRCLCLPATGTGQRRAHPCPPPASSGEAKLAVALPSEVMSSLVLSTHEAFGRLGA